MQGHVERRYRCPVAHPALFEEKSMHLGPHTLAQIEYDPASGEQRATQLQGLHTGAIHEMAAVSYLSTLSSSPTPVRTVPRFADDDIVLNTAACPATEAGACLELPNGPAAIVQSLWKLRGLTDCRIAFGGLLDELSLTATPQTSTGHACCARQHQ